jgi:BNR repeat-like domain
MKRGNRLEIIFKIREVIFIFLICFTSMNCRHARYENVRHAVNGTLLETGHVKSMETDSKWSRCFLSGDGIIYFKDSLMSLNGGRTLVKQERLNLREINGAPERAVFSTSKIFYALDGPAEYSGPGVFKGKSWRSADNLKSIQREEAMFYIPDGAAPIKNNSEWYGLYVYRTILRMPDSTWLMTMYGNFNADTIVPYDADAKKETRFMQRTFIVTSLDEGRTWTYLSTVAAPKRGDPVGEGLVEPAITLLDDGRLLCIMRSGHHFPLYASWSGDNGKTWSSPLYTGLDRGCDPCLITLHDGRVALSWGRRFPEGWSKITPEGDKGMFLYPGEGYTSLSISSDGGLTWENHKIIHRSGSCYTTIFEVEPDIVFMQSDQWYCRIKLNSGN